MQSARTKPLWGFAGWLSLVAAVVGLGSTVVGLTLTARAHGYGVLPPTPNGWAATQRAAEQGSLAALAILLLMAFPARLAAAGKLSVAALARLWSALLVGGIWALWGFQHNRIALGPLWRESVEVGPVHLPRALIDGTALATNVGVTFLAVLLAAALSRLVDRSLARARFRSVAPPLVAVALALVGASGALSVLPQTLGRPRSAFRGDVILISLDAMRADRLGSYGGSSGLTPHLDRLASDAQRFARAYCQEPWTLTSHMSMFTGLYPELHGLDFGRSLTPRLDTLPERLRDAGMRTLGSVYDCFLLGRRFGFANGFDRYEVTCQGALERAQSVADWMDASERPTFLFLHFYDSHSDTGVLPYESDELYRSRFAAGAEAGFAEWTGPLGASETLRQVNEEGRSMPDSLRANLRRLYDAGVAETDAGVGLFIDRLRASGRYDDALIVVVADHGEALGEAGHFRHERLMEETLRIPLLVKWPGGKHAGSVRDDLVETVDLLPTILSATTLPAAEFVQGTDLDSGPTSREFAFHRSGPQHAITTSDGWRLVYRWDEATGVQPQALRRVGAEPGDGPSRPEELPAFLDRWIEPLVEFHRANALLASRFKEGTVTMDEADEELLRSLGYLE